MLNVWSEFSVLRRPLLLVCCLASGLTCTLMTRSSLNYMATANLVVGTTAVIVASYVHEPYSYRNYVAYTEM